VITDVPGATPDTKPPAIVATAGVPLDQVPPAVAFAKAVVEPTHTEGDPVIAVTTGNGFTVTTLSTLVDPHRLVEVAVIVAVPLNAASQFIKPVIALMTPAAVGNTEYTIDVLFEAVAV
jgi:hypothetical protein